MPHPVHQPLSRTAAALLLGLATAAAGAGEPAPLPIPASCPAPSAPPAALPAPRDPADLQVHVDAERTESTPSGSTVMSGTVRVVQGERTLATDRLEYAPEPGRIEASGGVIYRDPRITVTGERAELDTESDRGRFTEAAFEFNDRPGRGRADEVRAVDAERTELDALQFTGCPPGQDDWTLDARRMRIDRDSGRGEADDVVVRFFGLPLFYTPWISFPVDDRRLSGLLPPELSQSTRHGTELRLPWYWNIAPEMDATVAVTPMTSRGLMLANEYRYLTPSTSGSLEFDVMPHDQVADDDRMRARYRQRSNLADDWALDVDVATVSDPSYFEDFGSSLAATTQSYVPQRIDVLNSGVHYAFRARLLEYQVTDPTLVDAQQPYGKLPQLLMVANTEQGGFGLSFDLTGELTRFQHDQLIEGSRLDLKPRVSLPLRGAGWFMTPAVAWRYTHYALEDDPLVPKEIVRSLPIATFDAGMLFERDVDWGGGLTQTLEPRLFYLKVPYRDQGDIPLFDTAVPDANLFQLFRDNRFIGADRQGDANQLSLALTSRLLDPDDGRVLLQGSIGQVTYFEDRQVTLAPTPETLSRSDLIAEVGSDPTQAFSLAAAAVFEAEEQTAKRSNLALRWRPDERSRIDLSYRFRDSSVEQADLAVVWPLGRSWRAIARWNYSMLDRDTLESLAGFEYESCCWAFRMGTRSYVFDRTGEKEQTIFLQLELKGLARVGEPLDQLLERGTSSHGIPEDL